MALGYPDTTSNPPGTWTKLQGVLLQDSIQYPNSDLTYYTRSNPAITWSGTWVNKYGQWGSYNAGGKKYKESYGASDYVEITATNCTNFAIITENKTDGDTIVVTVNGSAPSALGITGVDGFSTYHAAGAGEDYIQLHHTFYSGLNYSTSYTFRFTKSSDTSKAFKVWGFMKWSKASIHIVTNARSGSGAQVELDDLDENVYDLNPDLVINQFHAVNISPADPNTYYSTQKAIVDSLINRGYPQLCVISNRRWPEDATHKILAQLSRLICSDDNVPCIDIYALTKENEFIRSYFSRDGVHPNSTGMLYYVWEYLKVLDIRTFGGN